MRPSPRFYRYGAGPILVSFALLCSLVLSPSVSGARERSVYLGIESFTWREFTDGERAVKESGPRFGAGFSWQYEYQNQATWNSAAEVFGGVVDYDGEACDIVGSCVPATSDVNYVGLRLKSEVGRSFGLATVFSLEPFAGLGLDLWRRDVNGGRAQDGTPTAGYIEDWLTLHGRLGLRGRIEFNERAAFFAEGGIKLPVYNRNTAYLSDIGYGNDITLEPGRKNSFFAETGVSIARIRVTVFYDSMRFSQSNTEFAVSAAGTRTGFRQPQSDADVYGIRAGWIF
jgi:hypothetical protein